MVIEDEPIGFVEARFEGEICYPASFLTQFTLFPVVIITGLEPNIDVEELASQSLQECSRDQPVQIALMSQDDLGSGQKFHHSGQRNRCICGRPAALPTIRCILSLKSRLH